MKKLLTGCLSGILATSMLLCAGCGGKEPEEPPVTPDRAGTAFESPTATMEIDATVDEQNARKQISDKLFGIFLEDINYASFLMDDNLIINGSFESGTEKWVKVKNSTALTVQQTDSVMETNPSYAQLKIAEAGGGISNNGHNAVPIAVQAGIEYEFSAFIKAPAYNGKMTVAVTDNANTTVYAEKEVTVTESAEWIKYKTVLAASDTASEKLKLQITFDTPGTVYLDSVSLETQDSVIGIKKHVYESLEQLSPRFVRFPGGCVIEGKNDDSAYDWKNSIGVNSNDEVPEFTYTEKSDSGTKTVTTRGEDTARIMNTDIWKGGGSNYYYQMEYSIGFYEYFLLCEKLNASAIPIVNCGLSCMIQTNGAGNYNKLNGRYGHGKQDFIDDALDLVAFAKGSVNSSDANEAYWAQVRTDMGHPEPFEMTYLGIGNEQWGTEYYNYYQDFLEAFKEARKNNASLYGDVELIVGNGVSFNDCQFSSPKTRGLANDAAIKYRNRENIEKVSEYGVQDHHYYINYTDFFGNTTLYDQYSREEADRYDVFVGEYSANQQNNLSGKNFPMVKNNWMTALSEAAYMTGLERNGDIVKLAAYAPVFGAVKTSDNQWQEDMIYYTNTELVRTSNYYVQQLFMKNFGSTVMDSEITYDSAFETKYELSGAGTLKYEIDKIYHIVSYDKATGDIIVKIVNASPDDVNFNIELAKEGLTGIAHVTELQNNSAEAVNSLAEEQIKPVSYTLGVSQKFGYTAQKYSVSSIRIHVK